jgi:hypothetical protein
MSWGFEEGKVYNRRADIHGKFAGQQQGGIITPSQRALVIIINGGRFGSGGCAKQVAFTGGSRQAA